MPAPVEKILKEVKKSNPSYSDEQAWATAWSIYCKSHPESEHCHSKPSEYLKGKSASNEEAALRLRVAARYTKEATSNRLAGLKEDLKSKVERFLSNPITVQDGKELSAYLEDMLHFSGSKTPRGGKELKETLTKFHFFLKNGIGSIDPEKARPTLESDWIKIEPHLDNIVKLFSDEGGKVVPKEVKVGSNLYLNLSGFSEAQLKGYIDSLEKVFHEVKGWRRKALVGGLKIALAGPSDFRGTSSGKYKTDQDTLYVKATPKVLKRTLGEYAGFDYIIIHELGHRYEAKRHPKGDFDSPTWWTSRYSMTEGEAFAELFAISNFGLKGPWEESIVENFEELMASGKIPEREPVELPPHLKALAEKLQSGKY